VEAIIAVALLAAAAAALGVLYVRERRRHKAAARLLAWRDALEGRRRGRGSVMPAWYDDDTEDAR
jgi:type II secretory pathway pseudopilin PulG